MGLVIEEGIGRGVTVKLTKSGIAQKGTLRKGTEYVLPREGYTEPGG